MSDNNEIDLSENSEEDFSASEDDWVPDKKPRHETSSSDSSDDFEDTPAKKAIARYIKFYIVFVKFLTVLSYV